VKRLLAFPAWAMEALVDPWGPLVLAPLLSAPAWTARVFRAAPHRAALLGVALAQTLFGTSVGRLVIIALPVLLVPAIERLQSQAAQRHWGTSRTAWLLGCQFLFQYARRTTLGLSIPPYAPHPLVYAAHAVRLASFVGFVLGWVLPAGPGRRLEPVMRAAPPGGAGDP